MKIIPSSLWSRDKRLGRGYSTFIGCFGATQRYGDDGIGDSSSCSHSRARARVYIHTYTPCAVFRSQIFQRKLHNGETQVAKIRTRLIPAEWGGHNKNVNFKPSPRQTKSQNFFQNKKSLRNPNAFDRKKRMTAEEYRFHPAQKEFVFVFFFLKKEK